MVALPGFTLSDKLYESPASLVYRGVRQADDLPVVIKVLRQDYPGSEEINRYRQEYEILRSLSLPGVIRAYDRVPYQHTYVIVFEDFGGESLSYWKRQWPHLYGPMTVADFLPLAITLADTLDQLHQQHIIHKDINPSNIVLNPATGLVKLIDFGISTQLSRIEPVPAPPGDLEGTLAYLSPEQTGRMNRVIDYRTDFYSLGVTFYELLTGRLPFSSPDLLELVHCHLAQTPTAPAEVNPGIPPVLSDLVMKLMAKDAEARYQSAFGLKADLERCLTALQTQGTIESFPLGQQDFTGKLQIPQKLYGREVEVGQLLAAFERVAGGREQESKRAREREGRIAGWRDGEKEEPTTPPPHHPTTLYPSPTTPSPHHPITPPTSPTFPSTHPPAYPSTRLPIHPPTHPPPPNSSSSPAIPALASLPWCGSCTAPLPRGGGISSAASLISTSGGFPIRLWWMRLPSWCGNCWERERPSCSGGAISC